jgi:hypothetical protein
MGSIEALDRLLPEPAPQSEEAAKFCDCGIIGWRVVTRITTGAPQEAGHQRMPVSVEPRQQHRAASRDRQHDEARQVPHPRMMRKAPGSFIDFNDIAPSRPDRLKMVLDGAGRRKPLAGVSAAGVGNALLAALAATGGRWGKVGEVGRDGHRGVCELGQTPALDGLLG